MNSKALRLLAGVIALLSASFLHAQQADTLRVSLLTCKPGPEVHQLDGHTAIRIQTPSTDSVWNFGVFDFDAPNFLYRFVKGETDYILATQGTPSFLGAYAYRGREVVEQELNLTPEEKESLRAALRTEALPQNRTYRYNYVKDNCATRPRLRIEQTMAEPVVYVRPVQYGTFRNEMRHFHAAYPWYQFGIDLLLGSGLDYPLTAKEELFQPLVLQEAMSTASRGDNGAPLVSRTLVYPAMGPDPVLPPTPWFLTPMAAAICLLLVTAGVCWYDIARRRITRWYFALWFLILGLAGILLTFMVFVSEHEATSPNLLVWWINPLAVLVPAMIWSRRLGAAMKALMWFLLACTGLLFIAWAFLPQSANPAFFPLMLVSILLSATYLYVKSREPHEPRKASPRRPARRPARKPARRR